MTKEQLQLFYKTLETKNSWGKNEIKTMLLREEGGMGLDYDKRKPLAWQRARELVTPNAALTERGD